MSNRISGEFFNPYLQEENRGSERAGLFIKAIGCCWLAG